MWQRHFVIKSAPMSRIDKDRPKAVSDQNAKKLASALVLLRWRPVLATAGHRFPGCIGLRQSRSGDDAHKTVPLFVTPYYAAGNGCNGTGPAGRALRRRKLCQCEESSSGQCGISDFRFHLVFLL